jgi:ATP-dependent Clp protease, protease subunit
MRCALFIPTVIEDTGRYERAWDVYSLLLKERIIFLGSDIDSQVANSIVAQLLFLNREDPEKEIQLYIHSPGGEIYAGLAIYDAIRQISAPVSTTAIGMTASFGTVLLAAGRKVHMHQPLSTGGGGQASDVAIQAKEIVRLKERLLQVFVEATGQSAERIERDTDRDIYLTAQQAVEYGLIDKVLERAQAPKLLR